MRPAVALIGPLSHPLASKAPTATEVWTRGRKTPCTLRFAPLALARLRRLGANAAAWSLGGFRCEDP